ncbi:MAG: hypothetical protein IKF99_01045 [Oscillospiraceae bacterium]|nr:hypothetical protein [Oscillospiraceae bacterium]
MVSISNFAVEQRLWEIARINAVKLSNWDEANRLNAPLEWYVWTGRAPLDFLRLLMAAKPFMIARKLRMGGSYDETVERVKKYLKFDPKEV